MSLILFRALLTLWSFAPRPDRMEDTDETLFVPLRLLAEVVAELDKGGLPSHDQNHEIVSSSPLVGLSALPFGSCKSEVDKAGKPVNETMDKAKKQTGRAMEKTVAAIKEAGEKMQETGKTETK